MPVCVHLWKVFPQPNHKPFTAIGLMFPPYQPGCNSLLSVPSHPKMSSLKMSVYMSCASCSLFGLTADTFPKKLAQVSLEIMLPSTRVCARFCSCSIENPQLVASLRVTNPSFVSSRRPWIGHSSRKVFEELLSENICDVSYLFKGTFSRSTFLAFH